MAFKGKVLTNLLIMQLTLIISAFLVDYNSFRINILT